MAEDITRPYRAARTAAAWFDRGAEGLIEVRGADRISWLQGLLTNDVAALRPGQGCYSAYLTPQGRMLSDMRVLVREDACWMDVSSGAHARVLERLETFIISEDVELRDVTQGTARIGVYGPGAAAAVAAVASSDGLEIEQGLMTLPEHAHVTIPSSAGELLVAANRELGTSGFDVYAGSDQRDAIVTALERGGVIALGPIAWDTCRIEAGHPLYGTDMDQDTIPLEAGLEDRAISFTKGCYVGQEVIVRVRDRGQGRVARRLMGLVADATATTTATTDGSAPTLSAGDVVRADREVGRITSAAFSPALGRWIALAVIHRDHAVAGARLAVDHGDAATGVTVVQGAFIGPGTRPLPVSAS